MDARTYVLSYLVKHPELGDKVLACIDSGLTWGDIAAILRIATSHR
jgi:hypothetical protein